MEVFYFFKGIVYPFFEHKHIYLDFEKNQIPFMYVYVLKS